MVGVLVLVDEDVAEPLLICLTDLRELLQEPIGADEQVIEVHRVGRLETSGVLAMDLCRDALPRPCEHGGLLMVVR